MFQILNETNELVDISSLVILFVDSRKSVSLGDILLKTTLKDENKIEH